VNIINKDKGIFRTINGNSDEFIAIGRAIKAGFACSKVDIINAKCGYRHFRKENQAIKSPD